MKALSLKAFYRSWRPTRTRVGGCRPPVAELNRGEPRIGRSCSPVQAGTALRTSANTPSASSTSASEIRRWGMTRIASGDAASTATPRPSAHGLREIRRSGRGTRNENA